MKEKYYIAVNTGEKYPLLKDALTYTEYFRDAMVFNDIVSVYPKRTDCPCRLKARVPAS